MTETAKKQMNDPEIHKGAIEGDRPSDEQNVSNTGAGVDKNGMPNDPKATAQDRIGANEDKSEG
jgi:hypothetical protein